MLNAYFPVVDAIIINLKTRFSSLKFAKSDTFLDLHYEKDSCFVNHYKVSDLCKIKFFFCVYFFIIKIFVSVSVTNWRIWSKMWTCCSQKLFGKQKKKNCEALTQGEILHSVVKYDIYPNIYKLLHVALSIPIGSSSCERSFSSMRGINTYLRSNMAQNSFTNLSTLNIERELSNTIKNDDILNQFAQKDRKMQL